MEQLTEHFWQIQWMSQTINIGTLLMVWVAMAVVLLFAWLATKNLQVVPGKLQFVGEGFYGLVRSMTFSSSGKDGDQYLFIVGSIFMFVLFANLLGQLPWGLVTLPDHKHLVAATGDINTTLGLALVTLLTYLLLSVRNLGLGGFIAHHFQPLPVMLPFHLLDHVTRPGTLALRLYVNILVGEKLAGVAMMFLPVGLPVLIIMMELGIGFLQAYIFALLSTIYISLMIAHGDHDEHHAEAHAH